MRPDLWYNRGGIIGPTMTTKGRVPDRYTHMQFFLLKVSPIADSSISHKWGPRPPDRMNHMRCYYNESRYPDRKKVRFLFIITYFFEFVKSRFFNLRRVPDRSAMFHILSNRLKPHQSCTLVHSTAVSSRKMNRSSRRNRT